MSRISRWAVALIPVVICAWAQTSVAQSFSEERLKLACEALRRAPLEATELQALSDASRLATNSPALRSRAMAAYSLSLLLRGNTNAFERAVQIHKETFPDDQTLIRVNSDAYLAVCSECAGSGLTLKLCPSCMGSGKCKSCAGSGKGKSADGNVTPCPACKRLGVCAMCGGKQKIETSCATCKGYRRIFKLGDKVRENYNALLTNMAALCQENKDFAEQFKQVRNESDSAARIRTLQAMIRRFAHRADLAPVNELLEKEIKESAERTAAQLKRIEREQFESDLETLRQLRDSKDNSRALATLRSYLASHPNSANQVELQILLDDLLAKQVQNRKLKNLALGIVAFLVALVLFQLVKPLLFKKRRSGAGTVRAIDRSQFSDPLTLTAMESKARVKTKTANIKLDE